jgi:hypothetical protein
MSSRPISEFPPRASTALSNEIVEPPTFLILHANKKSQKLPASEGGLYKNFQPLTGHPMKDLSHRLPLFS